ncbi:hypothetical protein NPIL_268501 [Nephila pilipes]|uniref:Uncharacterized protein n=1 Tax=Nephila pilipes TaxID=299642 RepID=A0A8X6PV54_NEPPI|nr:hypothetical protein NPIL_268501 [Nephila pilipes]
MWHYVSALNTSLSIDIIKMRRLKTEEAMSLIKSLTSGCRDKPVQSSSGEEMSIDDQPIASSSGFWNAEIIDSSSDEDRKK